MDLRVKSVVEAVVFLGLVAVALPSLASRWLGAGGLVPAVRMAGWVVVAAGLALSLTCIRLFVRLGEGTQSPRQPPKRLVVAGPYRFVRNPMLLGVALVLFGEALAFASRGIALYALVFVVVTTVLMRAVEEPTLRRRFGAEYEAYRQRVPRWLPRLPARSL
jgi:protein-S-isoprenylcysteine O-methyltransferase Ste14